MSKDCKQTHQSVECIICSACIESSARSSGSKLPMEVFENDYHKVESGATFKQNDDGTR